MTLVVMVVCDVEGCEERGQCKGEFDDNRICHGLYGGAPLTGWVDDLWRAPDGWTEDEDGDLRCPAHGTIEGTSA